MTPVTDAHETHERELVIRRVLDAPGEKVFRCWREPKLIQQWWAPRPYTTPSCEVDLRPGGAFSTSMRSPDGDEFQNVGVFLEVIENRRIVFTDAFGPGWQPAGKPFMVATLELEDIGGKTRYTARARHWTAEDREQHEKMGFFEGWGRCMDQLEEVARKL